MSIVPSPPSVQRLAIPILHGSYCPHFGEADSFALFEGNPEFSSIKALQPIAFPPHEPGSFPKALIRHEIDALIASEIGERAILMLADAGIPTYQATGIHQPADLARACLAGDLPHAKPEASTCDHPHHKHPH